MYNFNRQYKIILEDIIQSVTPEELKERQKEYGQIELKKEIDNILSQITYPKNKDGSYDIRFSIYINNCYLSKIEFPFKINILYGDFECSVNQLTTLVGSPRYVKAGGFYCHHNNLMSLIGAPETITDNFICTYNKLTSLEGCPKKVGKNFYIGHQDSNVRFTEADIRKLCDVGERIQYV